MENASRKREIEGKAVNQKEQDLIVSETLILIQMIKDAKIDRFTVRKSMF